MSEVFGTTIAAAYDDVYTSKDYGSEVDLLERIFHRYAERPIRRVLDLGCGTGNHSLLLANRGYEVVGVERSQAMLQQARTKITRGGAETRLRLIEGDLCHLSVGEEFDAALMMFAVLGYQVENRDVAAALSTAHAHLGCGGILVFDVWYGPAVLAQRPSQRVRVVPIPHGRLIRLSDGTLDTRRHVCRVDIRQWRVADDLPLEESEESHEMRFFFARELELLLDSAGLHLLRLGAFPDVECEPDETSWNVIAVAAKP